MKLPTNMQMGWLASGLAVLFMVVAFRFLAVGNVSVFVGYFVASLSQLGIVFSQLTLHIRLLRLNRLKSWLEEPTEGS